MIRLDLQHALSGWPAGEVASPTPPMELNGVTIRESVNGEARSRHFPAASNPFLTTYERGVDSQEWSETIEAPTLDESLPELLFDDELSSGGTAPYPLDAALGAATGVNCPLKPTRLEVAQRALQHLGFDLVIFDGPGLPLLNERVEYDYRTLGKSTSQVLSETVLLTSPRWWADGSTVYVDGRALQVGTLPETGGLTLLTQMLVRGADPRMPTPPFDPDVDGGTFETFESGTYTWTESAGIGDQYRETTWTVTKAGGQVVEEREVRREFVPSVTGPFWAVVYDSLTTREYHPLCSQALIRETQVVNAARTDLTYWNVTVAGGLRPTLQPIEDWVPPLYEALRKEVRQAWHAEGWLRTREEVTSEASAFWITITGTPVADIAYRRTTRTESNVPIGNGLWLQTVTEHLPSDAPVWVQQFGTQAVEETYPIAAVNTFTRISDGPPPTVSCAADPCRVERTPAEQYARELVIRDAVMINDPDRIAYRLALKHLALDWSVGDMIDGLIITSIDRSVTSDDVECEVTLWGAYE